MSKELIKKFYNRIYKLLQQTGKTDKQTQAKIMALLQQHTATTEVEKALKKLGLKNIQTFINALRHCDIATPKQIENTSVSIFHQYLENVLRTLKLQLELLEVEASSVILRKKLVSLKNQIQLLQDLSLCAKKQDTFGLMHVLLDAYPKQNQEFQKLIAQALKNMGSPVVLALVYALANKENCEPFLDLFAQMGHFAIPALVIALYHPEEQVRYSAVGILRKTKAYNATAALVEVLQDPSPKLRKVAAETLGSFGREEATDGLIEALDDNNANVRLEVVKALGNICSPQALSPLLKKLRDSDWEVRREVVDTFARYGPSASGYLAKALENDNLVVKKIASRILADIGTEEAVPALMRAIYDKDISVRERAVIALGRIQGEDSIVPLMFAFDDKAPLVRFAAIQVLINVGSRATIHLLNKALKDSEPLIRQRANMAIEAILERENK